jgi:nitrate reductase gamma subunit
MVSFHYGILIVLGGHVVAFLLPREILAWNSHPLRLYVLEISALVAGLLTAFGLAAAVLRRLTVSKVRQVTGAVDWILYGLLILQVANGLAVAVLHPWGSSWFASSAAPYLWSLLLLNPDIGFVTPLPLLVKSHIVGAYVLIGFFPFTRLVHVLVVPNPYLWRRPQVVRWYRRV